MNLFSKALQGVKSLFQGVKDIITFGGRDFHGEIVGSRTTKRYLDAVDKELPKGIWIALSESLNAIRTTARQQHRFITRSGNLEEALKIDILNTGEKTFRGVLSIDQSKAPYGPILHTGAKPHWIFPVNKKALRWIGREGDVMITGPVLHPGITPDPFLTEALRAHEMEILARFRGRVKIVIDG